MLKTRVITALIIAPSAIAAIFVLPLQWYALVFGVVGGLGAYGSTAAHGPFVHVDTRGHRARW